MVVAWRGKVYPPISIGVYPFSHMLRLDRDFRSPKFPWGKFSTLGAPQIVIVERFQAWVVCGLPWLAMAYVPVKPGA